MHKTSVYLTPQESQDLRVAAARSGRSQSELIREGVRLVTSGPARSGRTFQGMAKGRDGSPGSARTGREIVERTLGRGTVAMTTDEIMALTRGED